MRGSVRTYPNPRAKASACSAVLPQGSMIPDSPDPYIPHKKWFSLLFIFESNYTFVINGSEEHVTNLTINLVNG